MKKIHIATILFAIATITQSGCIMPPRGVDWPEPRPLDDITVHDIQVNQVGYFPARIKIATLSSQQTNPVSWSLFRDGKKVQQGATTVFGTDADSGDHVHLIDFTSCNEEGDNYTLKADTAQSAPFSIRRNIYRSLSREALRYFYLNRSGIPLEMPFTEDRRKERPAGHLSDATARCESGGRCDPSQKKDVSGGWYDAGDNGKYVVNGGISVWLLMHAFEHLQLREKDASTPDLNIPESANDVPDILDEARWEMEWMLKMQVQGGEEEGLVHHLVHNAQYTALGHAPPTYDTEPPPRYIRDTATSATLNLAAAGALCSRVFRPFDAAFADRCLDAAKKAFDAAVRHPDLKAGGPGFIPYTDAEQTDDFFWAAAELFVTTGDARYGDHLKRSKYYGNPSKNAGGSASTFNWQQTDGMGAIALALSSRENQAEERDLHRQAVIESADMMRALIDAQGYRYPMAKRSYPWGSNSFVLNNAVVLLVAYRLTGDSAYLDGAVLAMDYILGRNPLDFSYVSGYGTLFMQFPHHRFFAPTYDKRLPFIPDGSVAGGPNPSLQDNAAKGWRAGCAPAKCYVDSIESFSTNEVAINWNAALAWVALILDSEAGH